MSIVLDASAVYDLLTAERCREHISGARELIAPDLIVPELLNARWRVERSGGNPPSAARTIGYLSLLTIMPSLGYAGDAAALAKRLDHPVYDCLYVALAQRERAKLLTLDERLIKKLRAARLSKLLCG